MKLSTLAVVSFAHTVLAQTFYETRIHYITVDAAGQVVGSSISTEAVAGTTTEAAAASTVAPTTLVIDTTSSSTSATTSPAAASSSTSTTASPAAASTSTSAVNAATTTTSSLSAVTETASSTFAQAAAAKSSDDSATSSSGVDESFATAMLDAHNSKRADHSVGALTWDTTVYQYAQAYADKYQCGSDLVHSGGKYGENLASGYKTGVDAFNAWYSEGSNYDYSTSTTFSHFTAIIWKSTTKLGCAYKDCGSDSLYVICSYDPAGNVGGEGKSNLIA